VERTGYNIKFGLTERGRYDRYGRNHHEQHPTTSHDALQHTTPECYVQSTIEFRVLKLEYRV